MMGKKFVHGGGVRTPLFSDIGDGGGAENGIGPRQLVRKTNHFSDQFTGDGIREKLPALKKSAGAVLGDKRKIIKVILHLVHQGGILPSAGGAEAASPLLQAADGGVKIRREVALIVQQSAVHVGKNQLDHFIAPFLQVSGGCRRRRPRNDTNIHLPCLSPLRPSGTSPRGEAIRPIRGYPSGLTNSLNESE